MNLKSTKLLRGFSKSQGSIIRLYTHVRFSLKHIRESTFVPLRRHYTFQLINMKTYPSHNKMTDFHILTVYKGGNHSDLDVTVHTHSPWLATVIPKTLQRQLTQWPHNSIEYDLFTLTPVTKMNQFGFFQNPRECWNAHLNNFNHGFVNLSVRFTNSLL